MNLEKYAYHFIIKKNFLFKNLRRKKFGPSLKNFFYNRGIYTFSPHEIPADIMKQYRKSIYFNPIYYQTFYGCFLYSIQSKFGIFFVSKKKIFLMKINIVIIIKFSKLFFWIYIKIF